MLAEVVNEYDDVSYGGERIEKSADPEIFISGTKLAVNSIGTLVTIYKLFKDDLRVQYINLLNPGSDALIVQAETAKVQNIKNPEKYEFHEVDGDAGKWSGSTSSRRTAAPGAPRMALMD